MKTRMLLSAILLLCIGIAIGGPRYFASAQTDPVILNPGFEGEFVERGAGEVQVAEHWEYGYDGSYGHRPEYKPEFRWIGQGRVLSGDKAQKWFTTYSRHESWLWQKVSGATPGQWYKFTAWVWVWSSGTNHDGGESAPPTGKVWIHVCANPWGDGNLKAPSTQCGLTFVDWYDEWVQLEVVFQAKVSDPAVFLWDKAEYGVQHNDAYFDSTNIEIWQCESEPCPTCTPQPTFTPYPTYTAYPTYTPQPTCEPDPVCPTSEPGDCPSLGQIREAMETVVSEREPVRWP